MATKTKTTLLNAYSDSYLGGNGDDLIKGFNWNDGAGFYDFSHVTWNTSYSQYGTYTGASGNGNTLAGGNGNDTIIGSNAADLIYGDSRGNTNTSDNGNDSIYGGFGNDEIHGGNAKDVLFGQQDNDALFGENGADYLDGGSGDDILIGGLGGDVLTGDSVDTSVDGADTFIYTTNRSNGVADSPYTDSNGVPNSTALGASSWDIITDFNATGDEGDKIDLTALNSWLGGDGPTKLTWSDAVTTDHDAGIADPARAHTVWTNYGSGDVGEFIYADIDGDGRADMKIQVSNVGSDDFIGVNHAPDATADSNDDDPVTESGVYPGNIVFAGDDTAAGNVLDNDSDPDGDSIHVSAVNGDAANVDVDVEGTYGTLHLDGSGNYTYTLNNSDPDTDALPQDASASDVFTYTVTDIWGASTTATLTIDITGTNDAPVARGDSYGATEDLVLTADGAGGNPAGVIGHVDLTPTDESLLDPAGDDYDVDTGDSFAIASVDGIVDGGAGDLDTAIDGSIQFQTTKGGIVTINLSDGTFTYDQNGVFNSLGEGVTDTDSFQYQLIDSNSAVSNFATVDFTITGVNDAPVARGDSYSVTEDFVLTADGSGGDPNGVTDHVDTGELALTPSGDDYDPDSGDTFTVASVMVGGTAIVDGDGNDLDGAADGSIQFYTSAGGTVTLDLSTGHFTYDQNGVFDGLNNGGTDTDGFMYNLTDGTDESDWATVDITINGVTDASGPTLPLAFGGTGDPNDFDSKVGSATSGWTFAQGTGGGETINGDTGSPDKDIINGLGGDDTINAGDNGDQVYAGEGNDTVNGGKGADSLYGGAGDDTIYGQYNPETFTPPDNNDAIYGGSGSDTLYGQAGDDLLFGGSGSDTISDGSGIDTIIGGYGADTINLTADGVADTIKFVDLKDTNDVISGFSGADLAGGDVLDVSGLDADTTTGGDDAFVSVTNSAGLVAHGITWTTDGTNVTVLADTDGNTTTAEFMFVLTGVTSLSSGDFNPGL